MKLLGNRVLLSRVEEEKKEGFATVEVQDNFIYKGRVEQIGDSNETSATQPVAPFAIGDTVIFAKYSPDTQELKHEGKTYKVVKLEDIIAIV